MRCSESEDAADSANKEKMGMLEEEYAIVHCTGYLKVYILTYYNIIMLVF